MKFQTPISNMSFWEQVAPGRMVKLRPTVSFNGKDRAVAPGPWIVTEVVFPGGYRVRSIETGEYMRIGWQDVAAIEQLPC